MQPATPPQEHDPELEQFLSSLTAEDRALVKVKKIAHLMRFMLLKYVE